MGKAARYVLVGVMSRRSSLFYEGVGSEGRPRYNAPKVYPWAAESRCRLPSRAERAAYQVGCERQFAQAHAGQRGDRIADRAGDQRDAVLSGTQRWMVGGDHFDLDVGHIRHPRDLIVGE